MNPSTFSGWHYRYFIIGLEQRDPPAPWGIHTNLTFNDVPACNCPATFHSGLDVHGREFGGFFNTDTTQTIDAMVPPISPATWFTTPNGPPMLRKAIGAAALFECEMSHHVHLPLALGLGAA